MDLRHGIRLAPVTYKHQLLVQLAVLKQRPCAKARRTWGLVLLSVRRTACAGQNGANSKMFCTVNFMPCKLIVIRLDMIDIYIGHV